MSEHLDRQRRRDIRRAMGPEALDLIQRQMQVVSNFERIVEALARRVHEIEARVDRLARHQDDPLVQGRTVWGRWPWRGQG